MDLVGKLALLLVPSSVAPLGPGPSGSPTNLAVENYGSDKARPSWANGDATAYTRIYQRADSCSGSESLLVTINPGITSFDSSVTVMSGFLVSHYKNGQESAKTSCVEWDPEGA